MAGSSEPVLDPLRQLFGEMLEALTQPFELLGFVSAEVRGRPKDIIDRRNHVIVCGCVAWDIRMRW